MKLSKLVSMAALSGMMLGAGPIATAQAQDTVHPPSIKTERVEPLPRTKLSDASTPYVEAMKRFYRQRDSLDAHTPRYSDTVWEAAFTTSNEDVIFVTVGDSSSVIGTLDKDTTWSADYLRANIDSSFHEELPQQIQSGYPQNADRLDSHLDNEAETTWNSGRATTLRSNIEDHGHFLESYEAMFADVNLPVSLVAQLGVESAFNPRASSYAACGIGQIRDWHVTTITEEQPFPDCKNPVMADVTAKILKGQMVVYDVPTFQSSMMYHSGIGNWKKMCAIGKELSDSSQSTRCYDGLQAMLNNREDQALNDLLGSAGIDTRHYPAQVNEMIKVYRSIPDHRVRQAYENTSKQRGPLSH